jgi:large subunit ribosomal protein L17
MSSIKHRHLGRKSSHRIALLRNLVTSLIEKESIRTTWPKAKEAQIMAEKLITLGKRNTNAAKQRAQGMLFVSKVLLKYPVRFLERIGRILYFELSFHADIVFVLPPQQPDKFLPKLFGPLRERYADRPGGYTRVLRTEPLDRDKKHKPDDREYNPGQPESAILELVDGPRDMRFAITARALVRQREREEEGTGGGLTEILAANIRKVTRFRKGGEEVLEKEVRRLERERGGKWTGTKGEGSKEWDQDVDEEDYDKDDDRDDDRYDERYDERYQKREGERDDVVERTPQGNSLLRRRR